MAHSEDRDCLLERLKWANSFNRMDTVLALHRCKQVSDAEWFEILGEEWSCCDNISLHQSELLMNSPFGGRIGNGPILEMMTAEEMEIYAALSDDVTVYRGCYAANKTGFSWSLDREVAEKFPLLNRYQQSGQPLLVKAIALKKNIFAIKVDRNEAEVITWQPRQVSTSHIRVTAGRA